MYFQHVVGQRWDDSQRTEQQHTAINVYSLITECVSLNQVILENFRSGLEINGFR